MLLQDPVNTAFSGFSRVTNFLQDMLNPQEIPQSRPAHERASVFVEETNKPPAEDDAVGGFEVITCVSRTGCETCAQLHHVHLFVRILSEIVYVQLSKSVVVTQGSSETCKFEVWCYIVQHCCTVVYEIIISPDFPDSVSDTMVRR